jgi:hypothetical protein
VVSEFCRWTLIKYLTWADAQGVADVAVMAGPVSRSTQARAMINPRSVLVFVSCTGYASRLARLADRGFRLFGCVEGGFGDGRVVRSMAAAKGQTGGGSMSQTARFRAAASTASG